ncbi:DNA polymerase sigma-like protein, putative [Trypanosoma cruzi marinkellei]|uniref:DNA polymerase sigma-like protein, putative n=1 Tax=Trypanosoma cruzi marinkellei TaxID=85056 RepID=K2NH68_TRYCR|nr:DNA polymerase sigma-like protein, putative [Trypanosoma cruzi marinkellei]
MSCFRNAQRDRNVSFKESASKTAVKKAMDTNLLSISGSRGRGRNSKRKKKNMRREMAVPRANAECDNLHDRPPLPLQLTHDFLDTSDSFPLELSLQAVLRAISPTPNEHEYARQVFYEMNAALSSLDLHVEIFGSWRTGLCIPSSDMDFVALQKGAAKFLTGETDRNRGGSNHNLNSKLDRLLTEHLTISNMSRGERKRLCSGALNAVGNKLRSSSFFRVIRHIAHAKVPIVKAVHRGGMKVDVSFLSDGMLSSHFLCEEFKKEPFLLARGIIILVKALVANCSLDDPSVGGLGSFPISIMVLWFLYAEVAQHYPPEFRKSYAICLVGFLKYYSIQFNYKCTGIDYANKRTFEKPATSELCIMNPLNPGANCAVAATLFGSQVVHKFREAYTVFSQLLECTSDVTCVKRAVLQAFHRSITSVGGQAALWRQREKKCQTLESEEVPQHLWEEATLIYIGDPMGR